MIRVLLVEDDAMIREMTRIFLESQKRFEVVCAASGEEALAHAKDPFDVILLDILLPDTNGMQLCQTLRSGHHCPIIFTSCLDDVDTIVHALELGWRCPQQSASPAQWLFLHETLGSLPSVCHDTMAQIKSSLRTET